jgi:hypothetical protein
MEIGKKFKDINSYNENMSKHIKDKLFWIDDFSDKSYTIVDFGCADGAIINNLCSINKDNPYLHTYIGYDISETMINIAKSNFNGDDNEDVTFTCSWNEVKEKLNDNRHDIKILFLSSVIHEVYSYAKSYDEIYDFWDKVLNTGFDYVIVRDMMVTYDTYSFVNSSDSNKIYGKVKYEKQVAEFEEKFGKLTIRKNFIHFLLKYRWKINWEREINEDYFPIMIESFLKYMKEDYNIDYLERFYVPFLKHEIKKDFDIDLTDYTHIKVIFSKKKECFAENYE